MKQLVILFMMLSMTAFSQTKTNTDKPRFSYKTLTKVSTIVHTENGAFCYIYYGGDLKGPYRITNPSEITKKETSMYIKLTSDGYEFKEYRYFLVGEVKDKYYDLWPEGNMQEAIRIHNKCFFSYKSTVTGTIW